MLQCLPQGLGGFLVGQLCPGFVELLEPIIA